MKSRREPQPQEGWETSRLVWVQLCTIHHRASGHVEAWKNAKWCPTRIFVIF